MGQAMGDVFPLALGVALSPVPIIAVILMLGTPRARSTGTAFGIGWVAGLVIVSVLAVWVAGGSDDPGSGSSNVVGWLKVALGALFIAMAAKQWRSRPAPGEVAAMPTWMAAVDAFSVGKALGFGALLSGINPKNLALAFAAGASIAQSGLSASGDVVAVAIFVVLGSLTVVGPTVAFLVAPRQASGPLTTIKEFMASHNAVIMMVVLLILGAKLIGDGVRIISG